MPALTRTQLGWRHPFYSDFYATWVKLRAAYEGSGGFQDGTYLIAHPREWADHTAATPVTPTKKLKARRELARYENWAEQIIHALQGALFRIRPTRNIEGAAEEDDSPYLDWTADVDGCGTGLSDWLEQQWATAAALGHGWIVMDRPAEDALTNADVKPAFLRFYSAIDAVDWTDDTGTVTGLKVVEPKPRTTLTELAKGLVRYRAFDAETWSLYEQTGQFVAEGAHGAGIVPAVWFAPRAHPFLPFIGRSLLRDPKLFIDHFNLTSELRELLRNQTFSLLNVPLGTGETAMSVEQAKTLMGEVMGTANVLFTGVAASYVEPSGEAIAAYDGQIQRLLRAIFRLASLSWESDTRGVEAEGALQIKREDMAQQLSGYANRLEAVERQIAQLWYRLTYGVERWEAEWQKATPVIRYPDTFDPTPFSDLIEQAQAALALDYPARFWEELLSRLVSQFLPEATAETMAEIKKAIQDELKKKAETAEVARNRLAMLPRTKPGQMMPQADEAKPDEGPFGA